MNRGVILAAVALLALAAVRRATARGAARHLACLADRREVAGDARGLLDHREQLHASLAGGTAEDVHGGEVALGVVRDVRIGAVLVDPEQAAPAKVPLYDALKDRAFEVAWMLKQVGITK